MDFGGGVEGCDEWWSVGLPPAHTSTGLSTSGPAPGDGAHKGRPYGDPAHHHPCIRDFSGMRWKGWEWGAGCSGEMGYLHLPAPDSLLPFGMTWNRGWVWIKEGRGWVMARGSEWLGWSYDVSEMMRPARLLGELGNYVISYLPEHPHLVD